MHLRFAPLFGKLNLPPALLVLATLIIPVSGSAQANDLTADLCIYEATPGGIAMAIRAAREGLNVVLVNHTDHPGGSLSSGLSVWDTLYEGYRAPIYYEVRQSLFDHYRDTYGADSQQYRDALPGKTGHTNGKFEAHVFEQIVRDLLQSESNITLVTGFYPVAAVRDGRKIQSVVFQSMRGDERKIVAATIFADCSYEGDLLPVANIAFRIGRESRNEFNEPHAGRLFMTRKGGSLEDTEGPGSRRHLNLRYFGETGRLLESVSTGEGDDQVQAFNFRTMLSADPANQIKPTKPADYDPAFYESLEHGSTVDPAPNNKVCWNRPQLIGLQTKYVQGDWNVRREVMDQHWNAMLGLMWHLQNAPTVPETLRDKWQKLGIAKDEFVDNGNRPYEIYVREGRRLDGRYVITEHDLVLNSEHARTPVHGDSIAFTDWYMDSHACTPETVADSMHEGKHVLHSETRPGEIPYRALLAQEVDNLLVPVCLSSTHVAWGAIRLEPTWMHVGEVAGFAAAMAIEEGRMPAEISATHLQRRLIENRVALSFLNDVNAADSADAHRAAQLFATRGFFATYDARPSAPCDEATAAAWLEALEGIVAGTHQPQLFADRIHQIEFNPSLARNAILANEFCDLAAELMSRHPQAKSYLQEIMKSREVSDAAQLSRGMALASLYDLLESLEFPRQISQHRQPNVLFIAVDDINDWIGCLGGNPQARTPNFDRLADMGALFTHAYCAAPACNPSRVALLTGIRPSTSGMYVNSQKFRQLLPNAVTLPQHFAQHGYDVRGGGKIFHHGDRDPASWGYKLKYPFDPVDRGPALPGLPGNYLWKPTKISESEMGDAYVTRWAEQELAKAPQQPTFLAVGFYRPHMPWMVPQEYFDLFPLEQVRRPMFDSTDLNDIPSTGRFFANRRGFHHEIVNLDEWEKAVRGYLACIAFCDTQLGRVLDAFENGPWRDNTIIVLWGDHGMHLGEKEHWTKYALWEQSTRTPLMFVVPGVTSPGQTCDTPVSLLDIYPTLCELCGLDQPSVLEGTSLVPQLNDPAAPRPQSAVTTFGPNNHAVRSTRWRYIRYADGGEELYDHSNDPHEWKNLAEESKLADVKQKLAAWLPQVNRTMTEPSEYIP